jgi:hypothetical protein
MKISFKQIVEKEIKYLKVFAQVRYWEDATINGENALEDGSNTPCKDGDIWKPIIDLDNGKIINWNQGVTAEIHYKICDAGVYILEDENNNKIKEIDGYVPKIMCPKENGYGDYIIMDIDENGIIKNWKCKFDEFVEEE